VLLGTRRSHIGRHKPEQAVHAAHALVEDSGIVMGAHDDLHSAAETRVEARGVANDHADCLFALEQAHQDLTADPSGRRGDEDHTASVSTSITLAGLPD
jgi:hypothetical protein